MCLHCNGQVGHWRNEGRRPIGAVGHLSAPQQQPKNAVGPGSLRVKECPNHPAQPSRAADITYLSMARDFLYIVAVMGWHCR